MLTHFVWVWKFASYIKGVERSGAFGTHRKEQKFIQSFDMEKLKKKKHLEVDGKIIYGLIRDVELQVLGCFHLAEDKRRLCAAVKTLNDLNLQKMWWNS